MNISTKFKAFLLVIGFAFISTVSAVSFVSDAKAAITGGVTEKKIKAFVSGTSDYTFSRAAYVENVGFKPRVIEYWFTFNNYPIPYAYGKCVVVGSFCSGVSLNRIIRNSGNSSVLTGTADFLVTTGVYAELKINTITLTGFTTAVDIADATGVATAVTGGWHLEYIVYE